MSWNFQKFLLHLEFKKKNANKKLALFVHAIVVVGTTKSEFVRIAASPVVRNWHVE